MTRRLEPRRRPPAIRGATGGLVILAATIILASCSAPDGGDGPAAAVTTQAAVVAPSPSPTDDGIVLRPDASAAENLPYFAEVIAGVWSGADRASGRAYVDALSSAGFDKGSMQVTEDESTVGNPAESIQVGVRWGEECLVGQVGPATGEPVAVVLPVLADGSCLLGQTRVIDW